MIINSTILKFVSFEWAYFIFQANWYEENYPFQTSKIQILKNYEKLFHLLCLYFELSKEKKNAQKYIIIIIILDGGEKK